MTNPDTYPMPAHGWTCFFCGETFTTPGAARDHFGGDLLADPACKIKAGEERGLVMALRRAEDELARYRAEDSDKDREMEAMAARHSQELLAVEEQGYERGLRDARAEWRTELGMTDTAMQPGMKMDNYEKSDFETIRRAFAVFDGFNGPSMDELWWRTDGEYAPVTLFVNCNDLFIWGCSDAEPLGPSNIDDLEEAVKDAGVFGPKAKEHGHLLWCCRVRGHRPQKFYYEYFPLEMHHLFDACGPSVEDLVELTRAPTKEVDDGKGGNINECLSG